MKANLTMIRHYFISYRRDEVTFVDSLASELRKIGIKPWVDFRDLIPGEPWENQLKHAIDDAEAILLVVSSHSFDSNATQVRKEIERAVQQNKRIILLIFEAFPFPSAWENKGDEMDIGKAISQSEWVDFRQPFSKAFQELITVVKAPKHPFTVSAPTEGFSLPPSPKALLMLSYILVASMIAILILFGVAIRLATVSLFLIPAIVTFLKLVRLPGGIRQRTFDYNMANLYLLFAFVFFGLLGFLTASPSPISGVAVGSAPIRALSLVTAMTLMIVSILMWIIMRTRGVYRWSHESGARSGQHLSVTQILEIIAGVVFGLVVLVLIANSLIGILGGIFLFLVVFYLYRLWSTRLRRADSFKPLHIGLESSVEDALIANKLVGYITKLGHNYVSISEADVVLVLLSDYKARTSLDPEKTRIIPVFIQTPSSSVVEYEKLYQLQGVDLRSDLNGRLRVLAQWIHEPNVLLDELGIVPFRVSFQRPSSVDLAITSLYLTIVGIVMSLAVSIVPTLSQGASLQISVLALALIVIVIGLEFNMAGMLQRRTGSLKQFLRQFLLALLLSLFAGGAIGLAGYIIIITLAFSPGVAMWLPNEDRMRLPDPYLFKKRRPSASFLVR